MPNSEQALLETHMPGLKLIKRGKVRDIYDLGDSLLMVATDRISAFDVVMGNPIPGKGRILNQIALFWFDVLAPLVSNHIIARDLNAFPDTVKPYRDQLEGRSMIVKKAEPLAIECIVRGYISGSGWKSYQKNGTICGIALPPGLKESDRLPEPIFTPSTKADDGAHDENIDLERAAELVGRETAEKVKALSLAIYRKGVSLAAEKGIIIADTKFEFGKVADELILIDEVLTPDSSRFWPQDSYRPGGGQPSFDKQYLRDYLSTLNWDKTPPGPVLPEEIVSQTYAKYHEALQRLTQDG